MSVTSGPKQEMTCGRRTLGPLPHHPAQQPEVLLLLDRRVGGRAPFPKACQKPIPGEGGNHWPHSPLFAPARGLCTRALLCDGVPELAMPTWRRVGAQGRRMSHLRLGRHCLKICQCASLIIFQQTTGAGTGGGASRRGSRPAQTGRQEEAARARTSAASNPWQPSCARPAGINAVIDLLTACVLNVQFTDIVS